MGRLFWETGKRSSLQGYSPANDTIDEADRPVLAERGGPLGATHDEHRGLPEEVALRHAGAGVAPQVEPGGRPSELGLAEGEPGLLPEEERDEDGEAARRGVAEGGRWSHGPMIAAMAALARAPRLDARATVRYRGHPRGVEEERGSVETARASKDEGR